MKQWKKLLLISGFIFLVACRATTAGITDHKGRHYRLDSTNQKWLVLTVWADWCPTCVEEIPEFNRFYKHYQDRVIFLGAHYDPVKSKKLKEIVQRLNIHFPVLKGEYEIVFNLARPEGIPTTFIFTPTGKKVLTLNGPQTEASLSAQLKKLGALGSTD